jgi:uncharacterized protein (DUF983 family)
MMPAPEPVSPAATIWRGFRMKCPNCGTGRLFGRFLQVVDRCADCGEELHHHRADDFPPYLVIFAVGHAVVPAVLAVEIDYAPPIWLQFVIWLPLTFILALALMQPVKGAVVALQWQLGLAGFEPSKLRRLAAALRYPPSLVRARSSGPNLANSATTRS